MKGKIALCLFNGPSTEICLSADKHGVNDPEPEVFFSTQAFSPLISMKRKEKEIRPHRALIILLLMPSFVGPMEDLH